MARPNAENPQACAECGAGLHHQPGDRPGFPTWCLDCDEPEDEDDDEPCEVCGVPGVCRCDTDYERERDRDEDDGQTYGDPRDERDERLRD